MTQYIVAFITGLTTGGLSCLAVQGGLLASSLAAQLEEDIRGQKNSRPRVAEPILWFLLAKVIAYTLLGFLLGWLGSLVQLSPLPRAILQIAIGIFMVGQALRILNVHPVFRYFNIQTPRFITRYIRRRSKDGSGVVTPLFLGALTVLIPCGITQAMMATAIATGNPVSGALLMLAFTLGTSPVFFAVSYFTARLGEKLEKYFMRFVALVLLVLGLFTVNTGLNLVGSPFSLRNVLASQPAENDTSAQAPQPVETAAPAARAETASQQITITVLDTGYTPDVIHARAGVPVELVLETNNVRSCSRAFVIPSLNLQAILDATGTKTFDIPAQPSGSRLDYSCSMGMYTGVIIFDL